MLSRPLTPVVDDDIQQRMHSFLLEDDRQQDEQQQQQQQQHQQQQQQQQLKLADAYIEAGYNLVWKEQEYDEAIRVLQQALQLQHEWLGKHHKDVGYTCNFIGAAHWLNNNNNNKGGGTGTVSTPFLPKHNESVDQSP
jgi:tetratricopeptide (TPR) repeat protein